MSFPRLFLYLIAGVSLFAIVLFPVLRAEPTAEVELLNASYDATRELYRDINTAFAAGYLRETGQHVIVRMSHGGSGKQARAVIDGLPADVVTLGLGYDVDALAKSGLVSANWVQQLPDDAAPYRSTVVFVVRKGNPKRVRDWSDLLRDDVEVITPNPRTSGGARWNYLAAWGWAASQKGATSASCEETMVKLFANVPLLDAGARAATMTFVERRIGDVYIAWESEALLLTRELDPSHLEIVVPSTSILAEPPVAIVDRVVDRHHTRAVAQKYLEFLYSPAGQRIIARHYFRPRGEVKGFPAVKMFTIDSMFGGWQRAHAAHFSPGGSFDRVMAKVAAR
jgi:sulfate/thiosulfate-binding protein